MLFPRWNFTAEGGRFSLVLLKRTALEEKLNSSWAPKGDSFPKLGLLDVMCSISKSSQQTIAQITASPARFSVFLCFSWEFCLSHLPHNFELLCQSQPRMETEK